ncbi:MAG TPA: hypothetical protein VLS25_00370 [Dehalococcoidia bacterium]|nr:hypothetical protein [Dehalococcoidia bacterium]
MTVDDPAEEMRCARHPKVETRLACGRCETPICPKCMVMTDVGARCPTCAPMRRLPQFEITPDYILRGLAAALAAGGVAGFIWGAVIPNFFGFFIIFVGIGLGYAVAEPVSWATNRKAGPALQIVAALGLFLAYAVHSLVGFNTLFPSGDLFGWVALIVAVVVAVNRLRY